MVFQGIGQEMMGLLSSSGQGPVAAATVCQGQGTDRSLEVWDGTQ